MAPSKPSPLQANIVTIETYNTVLLKNGDIFTLVTPYAGPYYYNVFNLGPCTVYYRDDADPKVGDPDSCVLPPGCADNLVVIPDGPTGLRFLAGPPCAPGRGLGPPDCSNAGGKPPSCPATITLRLVRG